MLDNVQLFLGDCLDILPTLEAGSVDAVITDLPYGITACKWDEIIPFEPMWAQAKRILKPCGVFVTTASQPFTSKLVMSNLKWFKYEWIWKKNIPSGFAYSRFQPMRYHEDILVFCGSSTVYNPQPFIRKTPSNRLKYKITSNNDKSNHTPMKNPITKLRDPIIKGPETILDIKTGPHSLGSLHPTQKPVALYEYLIRTYTNEGDTILDFCMGSGTTGIASIQLGRRFIGIEIVPEYFMIAKKRIKETINL